MAKIYAVTNQKGGVGKTLDTINLAAAAAQDTEKMVCVIDLDPQGHLTEGVGLAEWYLSDGNSIYDAIVPDPRRKIPLVVADLLKSPPHERFHCIPANYMLQVVEKELYPMVGRERRLDLLLDLLDDVFDEIFIDCPPNLGPLTDCAIFSARAGRGGLIVPVQCEKTSIKALELLSDQIEMLEHNIEKLGGNVKVPFLAIIPGLYTDSSISRALLEHIRAAFPLITMPFVIPRKVVLPESYDQARSIFTYVPKIGDKVQKRKDAEELQGLFTHIITMVRQAVA